MTNDLNGDEEDDETLYIDALCANPDVRYIPIGGIKGVGTMLMRQIEWYARDSGEYSILKLSALPYVINYYRKLGFRHIQDCDELQDDAPRPRSAAGGPDRSGDEHPLGDFFQYGLLGL